MFRLLTSWRVLGAVLVAVVAGLVLLAGNLEHQVRERALDQVVREADLVDQLLVGVELPADGGTPRSFPPDAVARIDRGVRRLVAEDRLVGLTVWDRRGRPVYSDASAADRLDAEETADLGRVLAGSPRVIFERDPWRTEATATVLVRAGNGLVTEVFLPQDDVASRLSTASRRLYAGAGLLLLVVTLLALAGRRRVLRREHQALHDPLTGLGNRVLLHRAGRRLGAARRLPTGRTTEALLLVDLDGFKDVNDTLGHAAGDALLVQVAAALRTGVRPGDLVTRLGGDEFALLLRDLPDAAAALQAAASVTERLNRPFTVEGSRLRVGASVGVAVRPQHGTDLETLLRAADLAMYEAKRAGGGVRLHDPGDDPCTALLGDVAVAGHARDPR